MNIRLQRPSDVKSINKWLKARSVNLISEQSELGFIIPGVCAAQFMYCAPNTYMFDALISNPLVSSTVRNKALDELIGYMVKHYSNSNILAFSVDSRTIERAKKHGFEQRPHTVLVYKG